MSARISEDKAKRLVTASVVTGVLLLVILLAILVFQMVAILQTQRELNALRKTEAEYVRLKEETEDEIALWREEWKIEEAARRYGFRKNGGK